VLVTLALLLPDFYILYLGQPANAVGVLMVMHVAIGLVTYNLLVRLAPVRTGAIQTAAFGVDVDAAGNEARAARG
jgi:hypothetical protein